MKVYKVTTKREIMEHEFVPIDEVGEIEIEQQKNSKLTVIFMHSGVEKIYMILTDVIRIERTEK